MKGLTPPPSALRELARRYSDVAHLDVQQERLARYAASNDLQIVRPVVLIDEVPWGEIQDEALTNVAPPEWGWLETHLRQTLYQWEHFQVDRVVPSTFFVAKRIRWLRGIGVEVRDKQIRGTTGTYVAAHEYEDQLATDDDLDRLHPAQLVYDREATERAVAMAEDLFRGLMEVRLSGHVLQYNLWDRVATLRGVDALLLDLAMRPDFMHRTAQKFLELAEAEFRQLEEQDLLDPAPVLLHCTPACTRHLPAPDFAGRVRRKDVWGRCAAQIFGSVSPAMHDEFDLAYNEKLFGGCGLVYYGCCEPLDRKVPLLRRRFPRLRKISITPWADPERAAEQMGGDYVLAAKPNPAFVASPTFDPAPVEREIARYAEACRRHGTPLELVLKDISTIANQPAHLTQWAQTVQRTLDRYYG